MNQQQYLDIMTVLQSGKTNIERTEAVTAILGIDMSDADNRRHFVEKVLGKVTVMITTENSVSTVVIDDVEVSSNTVELAFIGAVVNLINKRSIAKFLPNAETPKEGKGSTRDGLGSPAPRSKLNLPKVY